MGFNDSKKKKRKETRGTVKILLFMLLALLVGLVDSTCTGWKETVKTVCNSTTYRETCETTLSITAPANETNPRALLSVALRTAINEFKEAMNNVDSLHKQSDDPRTKEALGNCRSLLDSAVDDLERSVTPLEDESTELDGVIEDLPVWLTGAVTFHESCQQEFEVVSDAGSSEKLQQILVKSRQLATIGLDIVNHFSADVLSGRNKTVPLAEFDDFPAWTGRERRGFLSKRAPIRADVVVALDGSGRFKSINEALKLYPPRLPPNKWFTIYIKAGVYREYVTVGKNMGNVMFIGDGALKTKITGNKNFVDGVKTMFTATVAIEGPNFIARDIGFENSAGPTKHQAVALRVDGDGAVFFRCQMDGFQDTLYVHNSRQFYRDCTITGTVDFIFGDAAAIFQNCNFVVRRPMKGQQCTYTAQGRTVLTENTGIVIQKSTFSAERGFLPNREGVKVFLGRPWKEFSRTIILQSYMGDFINPEGWMPWDKDFAINTCFYAEWGGTGPGSNQAMRVKWGGIKRISVRDALGFTVGRFFRDNFIKASGVPFFYGLPK